MKEIYIARIMLAFVGLLMIAVALYIQIKHSDYMVRRTIEQIDFDRYDFIFPDGRIVNMHDVQALEEGIIA